MFLEEKFGLKGKVAIITGSGRGIGQVVARDLAKAGAEVVNFDVVEAAETAKLIEEDGGKSYSLVVDVTDEKSVDAALAEVVKRSGSIDILFNNAGICLHKSTFDATVAEWRKVVDINLTGEYIMARAVGKIMADKGIHGSIINMASMSASIVNIPQWQASYNASKAGVRHLTKSLAIEWAEYGLRVNSLSPGDIATPMSMDTPQELKDQWLGMMPMGRMGKPEELSGAVIYLASDASSYTNGHDLVVDGAYTSA
jgi:NAD(P)-dependent dehydrogenase (short-subunit alcohol dehydrogenase family)